MKVKIDARTRLMLMRRDPPFCGVLAAMVAGAALGEKIHGVVSGETERKMIEYSRIKI